MRIYAEYIEDSGLCFRRNTLLQFGDSWDLVGNAVLANPGSAEPIRDISDEVGVHITQFYDEYRGAQSLELDHWREFSPDSTMRFIEKIFNGWYIGKCFELKGIVQLFNTFNIKNQDLIKAVSQTGVVSDWLFSYDVQKYFHNKPTYFGFGNEVIGNPLLSNVARNIFEGASEAVRRPYEKAFSDNLFYHPMYVNRAHRQGHFKKYKESILVALIEGA